MSALGRKRTFASRKYRDTFGRCAPPRRRSDSSATSDFLCLVMSAPSRANSHKFLIELTLVECGGPTMEVIGLRMSQPDLKYPIEVQVTSIDQLFNSLDPFPFRERDLDKAAEDYIVGWAREVPSSGPITIVIHLPKAQGEIWSEHEVELAFHNYFDYRAKMVGRELRELFRVGRRSLAIGLVVLLACVALAEFSVSTFGRDGMMPFVNEGLIILGWVSNWRPLEIFLYGWWPIGAQRRLYTRLAQASVNFSFNEDEAARVSVA
jgi:hypothetical protein